MKSFLTIFSLLVCLTLLGQTKSMQVHKENPYRTAPELRLVSKVDSPNLISIFKIDAGFAGQLMKLSTNGTFKETSYSCDGQEPMRTGTWKYEQGKLKLRTDSSLYDYEFVAFRNVLFLVAPKGRVQFIKEFRRAFKEVSEDKEINSQNLFTASVLRSMYGSYYHKWLD